MKFRKKAFAVKDSSVQRPAEGKAPKARKSQAGSVGPGLVTIHTALIERLRFSSWEV